MNAVEIEEAISLLAEQEFDPANFPFAFLEAFGNKITMIMGFKSGDTNASAGAAQHFNATIFI